MSRRWKIRLRPSPRCARAHARASPGPRRAAAGRRSPAHASPPGVPMRPASVGALCTRLHEVAGQEKRDSVAQMPDELPNGPPLHLPHLRPLDEPLHQGGDRPVDDDAVEAQRPVVAAQAHDVHERHDGRARYVVGILQQGLPPHVSKHIPPCGEAVHLRVVRLLDLPRGVRHNVSYGEHPRLAVKLQELVDAHLLARPQRLRELALGHALGVAPHAEADVDQVRLDDAAVRHGAAPVVRPVDLLAQDQLDALVDQPPLDVLDGGLREERHQVRQGVDDGHAF
mmetsp:Transcript_84583/g.235603  ORF Transcript_84583/g.235603 Transcript_84583/m.235603 type:complete len:283 (-) Transcript_84583:226-1074(-)